MSGKIYEYVQDTGKLFDVWGKVGTQYIEEPEEIYRTSADYSRRVAIAPSRRIEGGVFLGVSGRSVHLTAEQLDDMITILAFIKKVNDEYES